MYKVLLGAGKQVVVSVGGKTYRIEDGTVVEDTSEVAVIQKAVEGAGGRLVPVEKKRKRKVDG